MALRTLFSLCSLAVLSFCAVDETNPRTCNSSIELFDRLSADLKVVTECRLNLQADLNDEKKALLLLSLKNATDALHQQQLRGCQGAEPRQCPDAEVPHNGGLVCMTVDNKRYCKPLCNHGYDFDFMRRSRLYDECSEQTGYRWSTQYVGGNKLAVCNASTQVSGAATAYFSKDCLAAKSSGQQRTSIIDLFASELKNQNITGEPNHKCLVC